MRSTGKGGAREVSSILIGSPIVFIMIETLMLGSPAGMWLVRGNLMEAGIEVMHYTKSIEHDAT